MGLLNWFGRKIRLTDGAFWAAYFGGESWAGKSVTAEAALQVAAFWACVRLVSQTIGTLPLGVYQRGADGSRTARGDHPLYKLLHDQPNADHTAVEFWEGMAASLCIWGNGFAEKKFGTGNQLIALDPMAATQTRPHRDRDGALIYRFTDRDRTEELPEDKVFHIRGFGLCGDVGLSPLSYARQTLGLSMATEEASARTFANGMRAGGWLKYKGAGNLKEEQRAQIRTTLIEPMQGPENAGKIGVLEGDFDWLPAKLNPEDAELLGSRGFNVEEVCRWLGVPPILIGHAGQGQTMWGSGVEQILIGWVALGLRPYLTRIEQAIKRSLLPPGERATIYAEFTLEGLLRGDSTARAAFYSQMAQNGIYTRNEIRSRENLPRMDGGDELTVQTNLVPLPQLGEEPGGSEAAARSALATWIFGDLDAAIDARVAEAMRVNQRPKLEVVK